MYQPCGTAINRCIVSGRSSERTCEERLVFLDAEAMLIKPFDDAFNDQSDITLTLVGKPIGIIMPASSSTVGYLFQC